MRMRISLAGMLSCLLLIACGGGGDSGGSSGGGGNSITLDHTQLNLVGDGGVADVTATFSGAGLAVGSLPGSTVPSWLFVSSTTPVTGTSAKVRITFHPTGPGDPGRVSTTLRFATADANGGHVTFKDLVVTGTINHRLSHSKEFLTYTRGATTSPSSTFDVIAPNISWTATSDATWLTAAPANGTGNGSLTVSTATSSLAEGNYAGTLTLRDTLTNHAEVVTVHLGVDPRRLETDRRAVAFSSTSGGARLARIVRVLDTAGLNGHWRVSSDAGWLTPSAPNGSGDAALTMFANATGLADGMHYATITFEADNEPGFVNSATVRAGFYVDNASPAASPVAITSGVGLTTATVMDPIRPYLYGAAFGNPNSTIEVWNVFTGELVESLTIPITFPGRITIASDGSRLYIPDVNSSAIVPVDLVGDTRTVANRWDNVKTSAGVEDIAFTRINGSDVVVWGPGQLLDPANGNVLVNFETSPFISDSTPRFITATPNGKSAFIAGESLANHRLLRYELGFRAGAYTAFLSHDINEPGDGHEMKVDSRSRYLYSAGDTMNRYDTAGLQLQLSSTPLGGGELDILDNGNVYVAINHGPYVRLDADLNELARASFGSSFFYTGKISSDERRMFIFSDSGVEFRDVGF
jgi:hypothetical protein